MRILGGWDRTVFRWFNGLAGRNSVLDSAAAIFTSYSPVVFAGLFAYYFLSAGRRPTTRRHMRRAIIVAGLAGTLAVLVSGLLEMVVYRPRPFIALPPGQVTLLVRHPPSSSFPSDHAAGSAAFAVGMWRQAPASSSSRWLFAGVALLVGISRLAAGVHWPSDVAGSFLLGGLVAGAIPSVLRPAAPAIDFILDWFERVESRFGRNRR